MSIKLTRLQAGYPLVAPGGKPAQSFVTSYNETLKRLEDALNQLLALPVIQSAIAGLDEAVAAAQDAAAAANTAAEGATTAASAAQSAADQTAADSSLASSYVTGLTLSADSAGVVTISSHTRVYGDGTSVSVNGGSVPTGLANPAVARIYYDQPSRAGGTVSYQFTTADTVAVQTGNRHSVGAVTIPAAGTQNGNPVRPPGYAFL